MRKITNAVREQLYLRRDLPRAAWRWGADVLLMPVNLTAKRSRLPQVVTILDVNFLDQPDTYDPWYRSYATMMFRRAAREADVVTTISDYSASRLNEHFGIAPDAVSVVYPGVDPRPDHVGPAPLTEPYALFVGPTEPHKNVTTLLDTWAASTSPRLPLVIAGRPGRAHSELVARASKLGGRVIITGIVDDATLERWYAGAAVFLFPSLTEGFGYPPLEAMARGVPVIASRSGSLPEVLGDAALYHDPYDSETLRQLVRTVVEDRSTRVRLIDRGFSRAARYSWQSAAASMRRSLALAVRRRKGVAEPAG